MKTKTKKYLDRENKEKINLQYRYNKSFDYLKLVGNNWLNFRFNENLIEFSNKTRSLFIFLGIFL